MFIAAGILQWVDNKMTKDSVKAALGCRESGCLEFFDAFWFMIVTVSTPITCFGSVPRSLSLRMESLDSLSFQCFSEA